jgi:hypothetical protein
MIVLSKYLKITLYNKGCFLISSAFSFANFYVKLYFPLHFSDGGNTLCNRSSSAEKNTAGVTWVELRRRSSSW